MERLRSARKKVIGTKQTLKAVEKGWARIVYVAADAETQVIRGLMHMCQQNNVPIQEVESMVELGKACGIEVGSASAAIVED